MADIDEMAFLDNDPVLMPIREPRPRATSPDTTSGTVRQPVPQTPVRFVDSLNPFLQISKLLINLTHIQCAVPLCDQVILENLIG